MEARRNNQTQPKRGFFSRLCGFVRWLGVLLIFLAAVAALSWVYLSEHVDDEILSHVQQKLVSHYQGMEVNIGSARLHPGKGIVIHDLQFSDKASGREIGRLDELFVKTKATLKDLLLDPPPTEGVAIRGLHLNARRMSDGTWDVARLWPLPKFGEGKPRPISVRITDSSVELSYETVAAAHTPTFNIKKLQLDPYFQSDTSNPSLPAKLLYQVTGTLQNEHFRSLDLDRVIFDPALRSFAMKGKLSGLRWNQSLTDALPSEFAAKVANLQGMSGELDLGVHASGQLAQSTTHSNSVNAQPQTVSTAPETTTFGFRHLDFQVDGTLRSGRLQSTMLPYPVNSARGNFTVTKQGVVVTQMIAKLGQAEVSGQFRSWGLSMESPFRAKFAATNFLLEQRAIQRMPEHVQAAWAKYKPLGLVDVSATVAFDGRQHKIEKLHGVLHDVGFTYHRFPYRMNHATGNLHLENNVLVTNDLIAYAGSTPVHLKAELQSPGPHGYGWAEIQSGGTIAIDQKLMAALPEKARGFVQSIHPRGVANFVGRFERSAPGAKPTKRMRIDVQNGALRYERFPYPLTGVKGTIDLVNDDITLRDFSGRNDSGYVQCSGNWTMKAPGQGVLGLRFDAMDVPLEDELRDALPPSVQKAWSQLRPRGAMDAVHIEVGYTSADKKLGVKVDAHKRSGVSDVEGRTISIQPTWFPYLMTDVSGSLSYHNGQITLKDIKARHGQTNAHMNGQCVIAPDGAWKVTMSDLTVDNVHANHELTSVLPKNLGRAVQKIGLQGPVNMYGSLAFAGHARTNASLASAWNITFFAANNNLQFGVPIQNVWGKVNFKGRYQNGQLDSDGALDLDSFMFKGMQLARVRGPLRIDNKQIIFGKWGERKQRSKPPQPITANLFDGQINAYGQILLNEDSNWKLNLGLSNADLTKMVSHFGTQTHDVSGLTHADLRLQGTAAGEESVTGEGAIWLRNADIYELPAMVSLLKVLRASPVDRTAFRHGDIKFKVYGDHINLSQIKLKGDAVDLIGSGSMNLARDVDLEFYTQVVREESYLPLLRSLAKGAERQFLKIDVEGSLDSPDALEVTSTALPQLNETLRHLFPDVATRQNLTPNTRGEAPSRNANSPNRTFDRR